MSKTETPEERTERFMRVGLIVGTVVGVGAGSLYAMSDLNPNQGRFLSLETNLILLSVPMLSLFLGWLLAKI